jgi:circadian clock protein KaiC
MSAPAGTLSGTAFAIPKAFTGVRGLDEVLRGGFPRGRATLIGGGPGTGKTILALEFLYRGALAGEPGLLVTFEEQADAIRRNACSIGWDLEALEREGKLRVMHADVPTHVVQSGEFDIGGLLAILAGQIKSIGVQRIVIDAADMLLRLFRDRHREEDQLVTLHNWLLAQNQTAVLTVKLLSDESEPMHRLEYMTDCVLRLDQRVLGQVTTRRLRVLKYRGSAFLSNEYPYAIGSCGIVLMPISTVALTSKLPRSRFTTGVKGLDELLAGGFFRGSSILIGGESGTGKTILACSLAVAASHRDERVLYVSFEESEDNLMSAVRSAGVDLRSPVEAGTLHVLPSMPEAMGVEEQLWQIFQTIESFDPQHLIVDSISACRRMGSEEAAFDFLVRLLNHAKGAGRTCIYLNQIDSGAQAHRISGIGISSLTDALIVLEQHWHEHSHGRRMLIVKLRGSNHSHQWNPFRITDEGLVFRDVGERRG